ncbi:hypothetical protein [Amycolatopsis sp.]|uniref:hypothetical protein n=1 Tax=Amycolatopsis sp. TaxID=37632 RepID=UPI002D7E3808|nr:hypothetical protein [Amycolatopsis sp.]HET6703984.1 hypothetical protein [Amycolatopsis sp.]
MGRRPTPANVALREHLARVMAAASWDLSTNELRAATPPKLVRRHDPAIYQALRALERLGICRRVSCEEARRPIVDPKNVYWTYTQDEAFAAAIDGLE